MRPSALREAVGIRSPIHFSRYYLRPLMEKGMIERTDPDFQPRANHRKPQPIHNHDSTITSCANG